jgi:hypothetical protein
LSTLHWQKSSYSESGSACVYLAAAGDGGIRLRESEAPDVIVDTTPARLRAFLLGVKAGEFGAG